jgi:hypothetical protein
MSGKTVSSKEADVLAAFTWSSVSSCYAASRCRILAEARPGKVGTAGQDDISTTEQLPLVLGEPKDGSSVPVIECCIRLEMALKTSEAPTAWPPLVDDSSE